MPISPTARAALREIADQPLWQAGDGELIATTEDLYRLLSEVNAQALRLLAEVDRRGLAPEVGSPHTAAWLSARLRMNHGPARRQVRLAAALGSHPATAAAMAAGDVSAEHAEVITSALDTLPGTVDTATVETAEITLIDEAARFTPRMLTRIAQRLHSALDPDGPQPDDFEKPDPGYFLNLRTKDDGSAEGEFWLDPALAVQFTALIDAASAPRPTETEGADLRTVGRRRHDALADLTHAAAGQTDGPMPGSARATIAVTVSLEDLRAGLPGQGPAQSLIPAATMRQLACDAQVIPIVLGSRSEVLDIGRKSKQIPAKIRRALIQRDKGCAFPGCDRPPGWTDAHHIRHWSRGGETAMHNLVLLCRHHHTTIHHRGWSVQLDDDGKPQFSAPVWLRRYGYGLVV